MCADHQGYCDPTILPELAHTKLFQSRSDVYSLPKNGLKKVPFLFNSFFHIPDREHGMLKLKTASLDHKCLLEISDNGSGMDEETLQKVFDPYFTGKSNGTGLGLTNSQNIIFNHKGKVAVRSEPGKGSTFQISLDMLDVK